MHGIRSSFRWALAGSLALHLVATGVLLHVWKPSSANFETVETQVEEPRVSFEAFAERVVLRPPAEPVVNPVPPPVPELAVEVPPPANPIGAAVTDVAVTPIALRPSAPVNAASPVRGSPAKSTALHGALKPGQAIVYVLDASGSMGEWGKFAAARRSMLATLREQPVTTRVQVIVYDGTARRVLPGDCVPATEANVARIEAALASWEPAGRSDHEAGLRAALTFRPDFVLILSDAADLDAAMFRAVLRQWRTSAILCTAKVTANGIGAPRELK